MQLVETTPDSRAEIAPELADADDLFRHYYRYIHALARRLQEYAVPYDRAFDAADLAQEIALAVYLGRHYFRPERGKLTAWLGRMAVRTAWAVHKSAHARRRRGSAVCCDEMPELADTAFRSHDAGDCWDVVARLLTPREVRALVMRFAEDQDLRGVGERLGIHSTTAGVLIDEALKKLHRQRFDLLRALGRA